MRARGDVLIATGLWLYFLSVPCVFFLLETLNVIFYELRRTRRFRSPRLRDDYNIYIFVSEIKCRSIRTFSLLSAIVSDCFAGIFFFVLTLSRINRYIRFYIKNNRDLQRYFVLCLVLNYDQILFCTDETRKSMFRFCLVAFSRFS